MYNISSLFMEPNEKSICALGNNYLQQYLETGKMRKGFAFISDKRIYLKGKCFSSDGRKYKRTEESRVVDLKDISGTGYVRIKIFNAKLFFLSFIPFLLTLLIAIPQGENASAGLGGAIVLSFLFWVGCATASIASMKKDVFEILFLGGKVAYFTKWYNIHEIEDFQRQVRLAKDSSAQQQSPVVAVPFFTHNQSLTDELKKLSDLLANGSITQDEYNRLKDNFLNQYGHFQQQPFSQKAQPEYPSQAQNHFKLFCPICNAGLESGMRYCNKCGAPITHSNP